MLLCATLLSYSLCCLLIRTWWEWVFEAYMLMLTSRPWMVELSWSVQVWTSRLEELRICLTGVIICTVWLRFYMQVGTGGWSSLLDLSSAEHSPAPLNSLGQHLILTTTTFCLSERYNPVVCNLIAVLSLNSMMRLV